MAITLTTLPNELLLRIYKHLDHTDLYSQSKTCITLHFVTLHVLFQRHCNGFPSHKLELDLDRPPSRSLLPALKGALFEYGDIRHISVICSMNVYLLYPQIRTLTAVVKRLSSVQRLHLSLGRLQLQPRHDVRASKKQVIQLEKMAMALQGLMDAAFVKGCQGLTVSSGRSLETVRRGRIRGQLADGIHGLVRQLGDVCTKTETGRPNMIWRGLSSIPGFGSRGGIVPSCRSVCIMTDLFIHPAFLDWTLRFLNHGHLTTLNIRWSGFSWAALRDTLPKIYIPHLESFTFSGWDGTLTALILFAQKHSRSITHISISAAYSNFSDISIWQSGKLGIKLQLDFPKLQHIELSSLYLPWFFQAVIFNPRRAALRTLPNLSHITAIVRSRHSTEIPDLHRVFRSIVQLIQPDTGPSRPDNWLSHLTFDLTRISAPLFVDWCRSYSEDQSAQSDHVHILRLVKSIDITHFYISSSWPTLEDAWFGIFPSFCAVFPNLTSFHLRWVGEGSMRMGTRDERFWQRLHEVCPALEVVQFNDVATKMVDLVQEFAPSS